MMGILKTLFKNKLFLVGLLIPLVWQVVYFSFAIPAVNKADIGINNLKIAIINEDTVMGGQIAAQLEKTLPFKMETPTGLQKAIDDMNNGDYKMVVHIPADFSQGIQQGNAKISYYINQAVPNTTKQIMETSAKTINQILSDNIFGTLKETIKQKSLENLSKTGLPAAAEESIAKAFSQAFNALKSTAITGDIQKINDAGGLTKTVLPLFIFLTFFIGGVAYAITHSLAYKSIASQKTKSKLYLTNLIINIVYSLIIPFIVVSFASGFNITFSQGMFVTWFLLSTGFFTFVSLFQMLFKLLGTIGAGAFVLILFPLQLISSGFMFPTENLPSFYRVISDYLPATYFGNGVLKVTYGGASVSGDIWMLLLMSVIFIVISAFALLNKMKNPMKAVNVS
jgi:uncharacterized phage infection (PIP) family protein YhgE